MGGEGSVILSGLASELYIGGQKGVVQLIERILSSVRPGQRLLFAFRTRRAAPSALVRSLSVSGL